MTRYRIVESQPTSQADGGFHIVSSVFSPERWSWWHGWTPLRERESLITNVVVPVTSFNLEGAKYLCRQHRDREGRFAPQPPADAYPKIHPFP